MIQTQLNSGRRLGLCSFLVMLFASGCSVVSPQLGPVGYGAGGAPGDSVYARAIAEANALAQELYERSLTYDILDAATGVAMFSAGMAALAFGMFDASRTALLAAGLTTGGLAGVRVLAPWSERRALYISGRTALGCAVQVSRFGTWSPATEESATTSSQESGRSPAQPGGTMGVLPQQTRDLRQDLNRLSREMVGSGPRRSGARESGLASVSSPAPSAGVVISMSKLAGAGEQADQAVRAMEALANPSLDQRAELLEGAMAAIRNAIIRAAGDLGVDPQTALAHVRSTLSDHLTNIRDAALAARQVARNLDNRSEMAAASVTTEASGSAEAAPVLERAREAAEAASAIEARVDQILPALQLPAACLEGLLGSPTS